MAAKSARRHSKPKSMTSVQATERIFGPPLLLEGEDAAAYDALCARIRAAVQPVDIVEEIFVNDLISLEWEVLRWRRLTWSLINSRSGAALQECLRFLLPYELYEKDFAEDLAEVLRRSAADTGDELNDIVKEVAQRCARKEPAALEEVNKILNTTGLFSHILASDKTEFILEQAKSKEGESARAGIRAARTQVDQAGQRASRLSRPLDGRNHC